MNECINQVLQSEARQPVSTYRLQMHAHFTFSDARAILRYLKNLGIETMYSAPIFEARPGSMHGYDVIRHDRLNPELGGEQGFDSLSEELKRLGMGLLLDIVPNHMGVGNDSIWWQDVLQNGHASEYSEFFDIDWHPLKPEMQNKLLLPILANQYGVELEKKRIQVVIKNGLFLIQYYDHTMPLAPRSLPILFPREEDEANRIPSIVRELLDQLPHVPSHETTDEQLRAERRARLARIIPEIEAAFRSPEMQTGIENALQIINGIEGDPHSFDRLHNLLEAQPYRLALWRTSGEEINYRRFFDVNDLVGLRMENPAVFAETHCLIRALLASRKVTGLRIDHCDGMFNPRQYLIRLQLLYLASQCGSEKPNGPVAPNGIERSVLDHLREYDWSKSQGPLYTVVEKILEPREYLPAAWPVRGTSGYDFVYLANGIFIQSENQKSFDTLYTRILGHPADPDAIIYRSKLQVMQNALASDVYALTNRLSHIAAANRYARDFTDNLLEMVLRETIASFPVYRTYFDERGQYSERDVAFIRFAIARGKRLNPDVDASAFDFLRDTLLLKSADPAVASENPDPAMLEFALKFQQLTGPVMAKGVEDTAFYVYNRFISSNEVGGSLKSFGISPELLHQSNAERLKHSPDSMLTTSTHDSKRSEDVRNRLNVLSEMPRAWASAVNRWRRMNSAFKRKLEDGRVAPDDNEEYFLYQTIVGAWPWQIETSEQSKEFLDRIKQYASKALSEAKINLSWINPDPVYISAVHGFLDAILTPDRRGKKTAFVRSLLELMQPLYLFGAINSLAQLVLKIASPGVPDFYQGTELWDLSLVDPDNRRPVDYPLRSGNLDRMIAMAKEDGPQAVCRDVLANLADGRVKLWTMHRALELRDGEQSIFSRGEYVPLKVSATGQQANQEHAIAFLRRDESSGRSVLAAFPRFSYTLMQGKLNLPLGEAWGNARLILAQSVATARYQNVFTGEILSADEDGGLALSAIFGSFPVALFSSLE